MILTVKYSILMWYWQPIFNDNSQPFLPVNPLFHVINSDDLLIIKMAARLLNSSIISLPVQHNPTLSLRQDSFPGENFLRIEIAWYSPKKL